MEKHLRRQTRSAETERLKDSQTDETARHFEMSRNVPFFRLELLPN